MSKEIFVVKIIGGLGNQLFQIAFGLCLAQRTGRNVRFDICKMPGEKYFTRNCVDYLPDLTYISSTFIKRIYYSLLRYFRANGFQRSFYNEKFLSFNDSVFKENYSYYFGYWQSPLYHDENFNYFNENLFNSINRQLLREKYFLNTRTLCVHVRRGDYDKSNFYVNLSQDYYSKAISYAIGNFSFKQILIVSDDVTWCKNSGFFNDSVIYTEEKSSLADLFLISSSTSVIIANSSFSWWGATLGDKKDVIAPIEWFSDAALNSRDRYFRDWILI